MTDRRKDLLCALVIVAACLALMWEIAFGGRVLYWGTAILQFQPWHELAADAIRAGQAPLWTHTLGNGAPLLANLQSAVLYPPNLLYLLLPAPQAMSLLMLFHTALAGLFAYALARGWGLRPLAAMVAGLSYGLAGFLVGRSQFGSMTSAYPWLPLSVLMAERMIQKPSLRRAAGLALALAAFLLAGHAQMLYYALLFLGAHALWRGWAGPREGRATGIRRIAPMAWLALAVGLALLLSAAQVLPAAELMAQSQRPGGPDYERAMTYSFWPWRFLTLLAPDMYGNPASGDYWGYANYWEDCAYIGVLPLLLAFYAVVRRRRRSDSGSLTGFLLVVALLSLAMALGRNSPLYVAAYNWVPGIRWFQAPSRFLFLYTFAAAMLAGFGVERLTPSAAWVRRGRLCLAGSIGAAVVVWTLSAAPTLSESTFIPALLRLSLTTAAIGTWLAASPTRSEGKRLAAWRGAIVAIALVDLLAFGRPLIPTAPVVAYELAAEIPSFLQEPGEPFRVLTTEQYEYNTMFSRYTRFSDFGPGDAETILALRGSLLPNLCAVEGVETASNYDPMLDARHLHMRQRAEAAQGEAQERLLAVMNVRYLVTRAPTVDFATALDSPGFAISENSMVFSRVRFVSGATQVARSEDWDGILQRGDFHADRVWLEVPPMEETATNLVHVSWSASYNTLSAILETQGAGYLVISETYHRGWRAWDNGAPVPVLRADYAFMAVPLAQAGPHAVELRFQPVSWTAGCAISGAALAIVLSLLLWRRRRDAT